MRILLVIFASVSGYVIFLSIAGKGLAYVGLICGILIAAIALVFEERVKRTPLRIVAGGAMGLITGLIAGNLLAYPLALNFTGNHYLELTAYLLINLVIGYLGLSVGMKKGDELDTAAITRIFSKDHPENKQPTQPQGKPLQAIVIDTSVIIDGRIADICETGFVEGEIIVPQFVLQELQYIADSPDSIKRVRGRRGLDILKTLQKNEKVTVKILDKDYPEIKEVDSKLVALSMELQGRVLTNDANLTKIAELRGVKVLNINRLATALKPVAMPGEVMNILVLKEGKEHGQGVGYLEDGTMVVIDNAKEHLGKNVDVSITSVLQTAGGRMIFSRLKDEIKNAVYQ
ncbi:MAG: TRAM domain-containing protein [Deltaproteobacteria bacterium]|nr:TRAM domain-containing protein [Deltaproteobacteria bacterium]